jgi:hypothetical protein
MLSAAVIVTAHDFSPGVQNSYSLGDLVQHLWFQENNTPLHYALGLL